MTGKEAPSSNNLPLIVNQLSIYNKIITYKKTDYYCSQLLIRVYDFSLLKFYLYVFLILVDKTKIATNVIAIWIKFGTDLETT